MGLDSRVIAAIKEFQAIAAINYFVLTLEIRNFSYNNEILISWSYSILY